MDFSTVVRQLMYDSVFFQKSKLKNGSIFILVSQKRLKIPVLAPSPGFPLGFFEPFFSSIYFTEIFRGQIDFPHFLNPEIGSSRPRITGGAS
jgi:hypothetical protein